MTDTVENVAMKIGNRSWRSWWDLEIKRTLDAVSTFSFKAPFEPEVQTFRDTFKPFSFTQVEIATNDEKLCTGSMIHVEPDLKSEERTVAVSGYGLPGVLGDCHMPASALPIAFRGLSLRQMAQTVCDAFELALVVRVANADIDAPFDAPKMEATELPFGFLAKLGQQRTVLIADTVEGELLLWTPPISGSPVATFEQWKQPAVAIEASFRPQEWFSEITGMKNANGGRAGALYTEPNPAVTTVLLRPHFFTVDDADKGDVASAVRAKLGRMIGNAIAVRVKVPTWRDPNGALWEPNALVTVDAPGCMIYRPTDFVIREVTLKQSADSTTAELELVLPGAFSGVIPSVMPWD